MICSGRDSLSTSDDESITSMPMFGSDASDNLSITSFAD
jgi:hypothetical protein